MSCSVDIESLSSASSGISVNVEPILVNVNKNYKKPDAAAMCLFMPEFIEKVSALKNPNKTEIDTICNNLRKICYDI